MYKSELHANSPTTHVNNNSPFPIKDDWTSNTVSLILATLNEITRLKLPAKVKDKEKLFRTELKHPLIEHIQTEEIYIPNDITLSTLADLLAIESALVPNTVTKDSKSVKILLASTTLPQYC